MARFMPDTWAIPALNDVNRPFFTTGRLVVQQCTNCGTVQHPPEELCHRCHSMDLGPKETNGRGTIYSYMVVHHPTSPAMQDMVPYGIVLVSVDEHPHVRVIGNVVNRLHSEVAIGQKVEAVFEEIVDAETGDRILMPQWQVVGEGA
jgi:uncharacterized OB-fold protein